MGPESPGTLHAWEPSKRCSGYRWYGDVSYMPERSQASPPKPSTCPAVILPVQFQFGPMCLFSRHVTAWVLGSRVPILGLLLYASGLRWQPKHFMQHLHSHDMISDISTACLFVKLKCYLPAAGSSSFRFALLAAGWVHSLLDCRWFLRPTSFSERFKFATGT